MFFANDKKKIINNNQVNFSLRKTKKEKNIYIYGILIIIFLLLLVVQINIIVKITILIFVLFSAIVLSIFYINRVVIFNKFISFSSENDLENLERNLNKAIYRQNDWFVTREYLFYLKKCIRIRYENISKILVRNDINIVRNCIHLKYQAIIYTKDGKDYLYSTTNAIARNYFIKAIELNATSVLIDYSETKVNEED